MTHEPYFYRKLYQTNTRGYDKKTYQLFEVPIGNAKTTEKIQFHPAATMVKYHQNLSNVF